MNQKRYESPDERYAKAAELERRRLKIERLLARFSTKPEPIPDKVEESDQ